MAPPAPLQLTPLGDTDPFTPTPQRPVRVRARSMPVDTHFQPHRHAWAQLAYCSVGIVQVTVATPGEVTKLGPVTYRLTYGGLVSTQQSAGEVYAAGEGAVPVARMKTYVVPSNANPAEDLVWQFTHSSPTGLPQ